MAIPTLVALIHDVLITIGVYSIAGFEVTPATVIAVLTILGFSIYDGIVVFDKVDENTKLVGTTHGAHLQRHGRPLAEPGADALAEHLDHRPAPGGLAAHPRLVRPGRHHAPGVRARPPHRPLRRRLLVDLHRLAAAGRAQGARAALPRHPARLEGKATVPSPSRSARRATAATTRPTQRRRRRCRAADPAPPRKKGKKR